MRSRIGTFARGGKTRAHLQATDHDFAADELLTLFEVFLPELDEVYFYVSPSHVTADFMVDCVQHFWDDYRHTFLHVTTLLLNFYNGPENHSCRTQFMARLTAFADSTELTLQLAYYPPYHSKYNPVKRVWGFLNSTGTVTCLKSRQTVVQLAHSMTWRGLNPVVQFIDQIYRTGIKLTQHAMNALETRLSRTTLLILIRFFLGTSLRRYTTIDFAARRLPDSQSCDGR